MKATIPIHTSGRGLRPSVGWLTVNRACNMRCGWCYAKGTDYRKEDDMTLALAQRLGVMMKAMGVKTVTLLGGEPTLWEPLLEFNDFCREIDLRTTLVTNATRFGQDSFWTKYCMSPSNNIGLSIKAFNESSFKCTTGTSGFELTRRGIERALTLSGTGANVVYAGEDPDEIVQIARFAAACGAKQLGISPSTPSLVKGRPDLFHVSRPEAFIANIVRHYDELNELYRGRISVAVKLPLCIWPRDFVLNLIARGQITTTCQLQHRSGLLFDTDGTLISCNSLHDFPLGKLDAEFAGAESLREHLNSDGVIGFYDQVGSYASSKCLTCSMRQQCGGGCPLFFSAFHGEALVKGWDTPALADESFRAEMPQHQGA